MRRSGDAVEITRLTTDDFTPRLIVHQESHEQYQGSSMQVNAGEQWFASSTKRSESFQFSRFALLAAFAQHLSKLLLFWAL
jgi:hypothetical protein